MTPRTFLSALVLTAGVGLSLPAYAQHDERERENLHNQGMRFREQNRNAEARDVFRRVYERWHEPRAVVRLGLAEMALSEWLAAEQHLQEGLAAANDPWVTENRARIQEALRGTQTHTGGLLVQADAPGATLWIRDAQVATLPMSAPLRVLSGSVTFEVRAPDHQPARQTVNVSAGGDAPAPIRVTLTSTRPDVVVTPPRQSDPEAEASNRRRSTMVGLGVAGLGVGAVSLGVGAALYFVESDPGVRLSETGGIVLMAAGGALVVTGAILLITAPQYRNPTRASAWFTCGPSLAGSYGLGCAGRF
jgi:hypothetical protein